MEGTQNRLGLWGVLSTSRLVFLLLFLSKKMPVFGLCPILRSFVLKDLKL